ncbi:MAG: hypothetical protein KAI79_19120 [Bacteroidales bacterium]|nr:hypothetical protein [Bacteroidales bacterium]
MKKIEIGKGLGELKFGMSRDEFKGILGEADKRNKFSYSGTENDLAETWYYYKLEISATFSDENK